ncbi:hypothetical protein [Hymenobacter latericus]|uniref:hypothetical protein n=1 Tax=Hymenobacter sp. YIM 151858-1 TaxID=2987688 RepID=UPI002225F34C|nr:hypothetical protein [Hymenobacter sp. YIM 151858-1]UYZ60956.1 hypothetical protein OIS50_09155 [Hymenobacter sp. YIM 151858-1]
MPLSTRIALQAACASLGVGLLNSCGFSKQAASATTLRPPADAALFRTIAPTEVITSRL